MPLRPIFMDADQQRLDIAAKAEPAFHDDVQHETETFPSTPDGENYTSDKDDIEGMLNHNGQCPECGGWGERYTLCQDCEDSGMIYKTFPDRNSDSKDESESEDPIGHCPECNGSGTVGVLYQDCEEIGMIYESSTTSNANSEAEFEAADQTGHCPDCNRSGTVGDV